jgi:hypothetical protein
MITTANNDQNTEAAVDNQDAEQVASIKLDDVTGGWGWYGPGPGYGYGAPWGGPGPYGAPYNPYAAPAFDRRAAWYAAHTPPAPRYAGWWY